MTALWHPVHLITQHRHLCFVPFKQFFPVLVLGLHLRSEVKRQGPEGREAFSATPSLRGQLFPPSSSLDTTLCIFTTSSANPSFTSGGPRRSWGYRIGLDFPGSGRTQCLPRDHRKRVGEGGRTRSHSEGEGRFGRMETRREEVIRGRGASWPEAQEREMAGQLCSRTVTPAGLSHGTEGVPCACYYSTAW